MISFSKIDDQREQWLW